MTSPRFVICLLTAAFALGTTLQGQTSSPNPTITNEFVTQAFGSNCVLVGMPALEGDFNDDGVQDIVIPARCTSPMMDEGENQYKVVDPYDAFFGFGNPKLTTQFASTDLEHRGYSLLIIHGAGPQAWRSPNPAAKFMIVNTPFKQIYVKRLKLRRKLHTAIFMDETGESGMASVIFWDGRKYRYQPMGSNME